MPIEFDLPKTGFSIRAAIPGDEAALRMLLPAAPRGAGLLVATDGRRGLVIGAGVVTAEFRRKPPVGPGVALHVIPPCRQCGVAGSLLERLTAAARDRGAEAVYAMQRVEAGSAEEQAWQWLGFEVYDRVEEHELPLAEFEPRLAPLVDRMRVRGRIPDGARIIPLYQADHQAVLRLHLEEMGGDTATLGRKLSGEGPGAFHPRYSRVLLVGERVVGCILAHRTARDVAAVDADIVAPDLRGGWANVWLKLEATRGALSLGIERFHFSSFDHYEDTRSFTSKLGA